MLREGSKSFYGASRLLPSRVRPAAIALLARAFGEQALSAA
jgi:phytoene/squalene synthetase